ncbi:MarR family winged helix-turn-helix transcriptional regulator [Occultella kanbiaonis]|uniref:MarR family winged helix-turn-helix transcriptional regulator n=1 Tax=Occultella kanbiaonis TaxID=2675754 RepID=UPI0012B9B956|nr:MarR family transcriptional regulator [Occultella kanbiaonis]
MPGDAYDPRPDAAYRRYLASLVLFHLAAAEDIGLTGSDYQANSILDLDGPLTSGELSRRLGLSAGATTRLIDRLVDAGFVRRVADPGDRRRVLVEHTGRVPERLTETLDAVREPIGTVIAAMSEVERAGLQRYLDAATQAYAAALGRLREQGGPPSPG